MNNADGLGYDYVTGTRFAVADAVARLRSNDIERLALDPDTGYREIGLVSSDSPVVRISEGQAGELIDGLRANDGTLQSLNLRYSFPRTSDNEENPDPVLLDASWTPRFLEALLVPSAAPCATLLSLNLWGNELTCEQTVVIGRALKANRTLKTLDLGRNRIGDRGGKALMDGLRGNYALKELSVDSNRLGLETAQGFASLITEEKEEKKCSLVKLSFLSNKMTDQGVCAIANALGKNNSALESLKIGNNSLSVGAVRSFADALKHNDVLTDLDLCSYYYDGGDFDRIDKGAFVDVLESNLNWSLERFTVGPRHITNWWQRRIGSLVDESRRIKCFYNHLTDGNTGNNIPYGLWPRVLSRVSRKADLVFKLLKRDPELCRPHARPRRDGKRKAAAGTCSTRYGLGGVP